MSKKDNPMREQLKQRLAELKNEFEAGQQMLADMENKKTELQATMLRISGAIQILEEMLRSAGEETVKEGK
jgi:sugar-specific transcriptional regulator TrmB